jgi:hypothetical protein
MLKQYHGTLGYSLVVAGFESAHEHARLIAPIRAALSPLFEFVSPLPYVRTPPSAAVAPVRA